MLGRVMADAAAAAHEDHADIGDVDHRHAVMPCPARQFEHAITFGGDRFRDLRFQPGRAGHGAVLVGDVELQRQIAPLCDRLDAADDVGDRALAVRVGRRADVDGEGDLSRNDIGRAGQRVDIADGADQAVRVGLGKTPRSRRCIRPRLRARRAAAPSAPCRRGRPCRSGCAASRVAPAIAVTTPTGRFCCFQHRPLLDVQFDIGQQFAARRAPPRRYDRDRGRTAPSPRAW